MKYFIMIEREKENLRVIIYGPLSDGIMGEPSNPIYLHIYEYAYIPTYCTILILIT